MRVLPKPRFQPLEVPLQRTRVGPPPPDALPFPCLVTVKGKPEKRKGRGLSLVPNQTQGLSVPVQGVWDAGTGSSPTWGLVGPRETVPAGGAFPLSLPSRHPEVGHVFRGSRPGLRLLYHHFTSGVSHTGA